MNFPFKHFIRKGEKYIVVENGKPEYVVLHYDDYAEIMVRSDTYGARPHARMTSDEFPSEAAFSSQDNMPEDISKIRLEDLPL